MPSGIDKQETLARLLVDTAITTLSPKLIQEILDRLDPKSRRIDPPVEEPPVEEKWDLSDLSDEELRVLHKLALRREAAERT